MAKPITSIRSYKDDRQKLLELSLELSMVQKKKVSTPEVIRRTLRIPSLKDTLIKDAELKRLNKL